MNDEIASIAASMRDEITEFVREIVRIPSLSGDEGEVIERVKGEMIRAGYDDVSVDPMGNLLGRIGSGARILAIDGHCDTVGVGNMDTWEVDPYAAELRDGVIFGRGAVDQKGGLASAIYAGRIIREIGVPEDMSLLVVASAYEEEVEGLSWQYIIRESGIKPEAVLLTEPTNMRICIGQRGRVEMKVMVAGISSHGSAPDRGVNAIYKMAPIIQEIERLNERLENNDLLGKGSITVTDVRSTSPCLCAVADSSTIHLDRRLTEGETVESVVRQVENLPSTGIMEAMVTVPEYEIKTHTGLVYPVKAYYPMWIMDRRDPLVSKALEVFNDQFDEEPEVGVWAFSTNGVATKGMFDIPTIGFGPGEEKYAHTPEDQVKVDDLVEAMKFYAAFALSW